MKQHKYILAYLLRHSELPSKKGGWLAVSAIVPLYLSLDQFQEITASDTKRFTLSEDCQYVRANYGHSNGVDLELEVCQPPMLLLHGTKSTYIEDIQKNGLTPRSRDYVHLTDLLGRAMSVAKRHTKGKGEVVILEIDSVSMVKDGFDFFRAEENTYLTKVVPSKYIKIK